MEEAAALGHRQAARRVIKVLVNLVVARAQAVYRVIAREHRAARAVELEHRTDDLALRRRVQVAEAGDLHHDVRQPREFRHRGSPAGELARQRQAGMVEHDRRIGKVARQPRRCGELLPRRLQLEVQAERREPRIARAPARVVQLPGSRLVAHAADKGVLRLRFEQSRAVVAIEPCLRDGDCRQPVLAAQAGDEGHLARRIARVPFGLDVHGAVHIPAACVPTIVRRQIRPL